MPKVLLHLAILFYGYNLMAQNQVLYLHAPQEVYFAGDTIVCILAQMDDRVEESAILLELIDSAGEIIDYYYTKFGTESARKVIFVTQNEANSGWYYVRASTADRSTQSNALRLFLLNKSSSIQQLLPTVRVDTISIFTEGSNPLVFGIAGNLLIKVDCNTAKNKELLLVLKDSSNRRISALVPDQDGFTKINFIPNDQENYFVELEMHGEVIASKPIDKNKFTDEGINISLTYADSNKLNILLGSPTKKILGVIITVILSDKILEKFVVSTGSNFSLDILPYPTGLLRISIYDGEENLMLERLILKKSTPIPFRDQNLIKVPAKVKRGDSVSLSFNLSDLDNQNLKISNALLSIQDKQLNSIQAHSGPFNANLDWQSFKYYFPGCGLKGIDMSRSAKSIDNYLAVNQYPSNFKKSTSSTLRKDEQDIMLAGVLYDSSARGLSSIPIVLAMPTKKNGLKWVITDEFGHFSFSKLNFSGNKDIYLTPIINEPLKPYAIKITSSLDTNLYKEYQSFISDSSWLALDRSLNLVQLIDGAYNDSNDKDHILPEIRKQVNLVFDNVDYDLDLNEFDLPQQMSKLINPIIPGVNVRKGKLRVFSTQLGRQFKKMPLILIDGIPYRNVDSLLRIDPVKFDRVQVITTFNKLARFGKLGGAGVIAFYTKEGFQINNDYPTPINLNGYQKSKIPNLDPSKTEELLTPHIANSYLYNLYRGQELSAKVTLAFRAPDITTTLYVELLLLTDRGIITINKDVEVEK